MANPKLYNLARMSTATTGTGTITLGSAVSPYLSFASAGVSNGEVVPYGIKDGSNSEVGYGTYTSSGTTLTRNVTKSTNSDAAISLSGSAEVFITPRAEDIIQVTETRLHLLLNSMTAARNASVAQFVGMGFADSFGGLTYVDTGAATHIDTITSGLIKNEVTPAVYNQIAQGTGSVLGNMTSGGGLAKLFDSNENQASAAAAWHTPENEAATAGKDWGSGNSYTVGKVVIVGTNDHGFASSTVTIEFSLQGSNDGSSWGTLYSTTFANSASALVKTFTVADGINVSAAYRYHRVTIKDATSTYYGKAAEVKFYDYTAPVTNNLTVASNSITLAAVPTKIIPVLRIKHVDSATAGTDYNVYVSRDGGTTYSSAATLTDWFTDPIDSAHVVYGAAVDVSGQPSGSNLRIKVITSNNKSLEIRDWGAIAY